MSIAKTKKAWHDLKETPTYPFAWVWKREPMGKAKCAHEAETPAKWNTCCKIQVVVYNVTEAY